MSRFTLFPLHQTFPLANEPSSLAGESMSSAELRRPWRTVLLGAIAIILSGVAIAEARTADPLRLVWLGWDADRVGDHSNEPDGKVDHHFRLTLTLAPSPPQEIVFIALYDTDDQGKPKNASHWDSKEQEFSILGVETDGRRLNPSYVSSLGRFAGTVVFDLFAADHGWWKKGSFVLVEVGLANGQRLRHFTRLKPPENRLVGVWNVLCPNPSPEAFEPMTLSGRFFMDVGTDERITGSFGNYPISGSVDPSGTASGTAGSGTDSITWRGTITKPGQDKPRTGKGDFAFHQRGQDCFGGVWWSD